LTQSGYSTAWTFAENYVRFDWRIGGGRAMKRREFIGLVGGAAVAWPLVVRAQQQQALPVVGFINSASPTEYLSRLKAFQKGLGETGYEEGKTVAIEYRWADGDNNRVPALVADLISRRASVIAATGGTATVLAAQATGTQIPIIFAMGADPVKFGLVKSFNKPGGNITGVSFLANALLAKQIAILHEMIEKEAAIGFLLNPNNPNAEADTIDATTTANALGHKLFVAKAGTVSEVAAAVESLIQKKIGALLIFPDPLFSTQSTQLAALAARHKLPSIYYARQFAVAGGLLAYGTNQDEAYHQVGVYTGRILKGEKPAELPVVQSIHFEFVVNLRSAKAFGLNLPPTLFAIADEVIE
jgi:putative ABC transport system substrate-binding protein